MKPIEKKGAQSRGIRIRSLRGEERAGKEARQLVGTLFAQSIATADKTTAFLACEGVA